MGYTKTIYRRHLEAHDADTGQHKYICVVDKKDEATEGGASAATTWNQRTLTDIVQDASGIASLDSNKITLPAGTYRIRAKAPAYGAVGNQRLRLYNVTADEAVSGLVAPTMIGLASLQTFVELYGTFTLSVESEVRIDHYTVSDVATSGLGKAADITGYDEYYTVVELWMEQDPTASTSV